MGIMLENRDEQDAARGRGGRRSPARGGRRRRERASALSDLWEPFAERRFGAAVEARGARSGQESRGREDAGAYSVRERHPVQRRLAEGARLLRRSGSQHLQGQDHLYPGSGVLYGPARRRKRVHRHAAHADQRGARRLFVRVGEGRSGPGDGDDRQEWPNRRDHHHRA